MKLKGTTIIELTDIETGDKKVTKETNFITNALSDICQPILRNQDSLATTRFTSEGICSIDALMRGLLLFDTVLEENPARYFPPTSAKMIGHASDRTYTGSDISMGSYNVNQSAYSDNERTLVWDFTSEQANGIINSVCLTTQTGGHIGHGTETAPEEAVESVKSFSNIVKSVLNTQYEGTVYTYERVPVYISFQQDVIIHCDFSKISTGSLVFYRTKLNSKAVDIFKPFASITVEESMNKNINRVGYGFTDIEKITIDASSDLDAGLYFGMAQDGRYLYITSKSTLQESTEANAWAPGTSIKLLKVDLETLTYDVISVTNTTGAPLAIRTAFSYLASSGNTFGVANGYMYVRSWTSKTGSKVSELYAINLSNNTDVKKIKDKYGATELVGTHSLTQATPFSISMQGKPTFMEKGFKPNVYTTGSSNNAYYLISCVSPETFIENYLDATMMSLYSTGNLQHSSTVLTRVFPTDNELYFGCEKRSESAATLSSANCYISVVPNALMTINNLSSPIEKTPAQTMRIIYKITKE